MIYHRSREMSDETNEEADERTKAWSPTQTHGPQKGKRDKMVSGHFFGLQSHYYYWAVKVFLI